VRTVVEIVARPGPRGRTVLPVVRASGQLAVRRTGPSTVHLVATAFGPLGGDDAEISLVVEEGATLDVRSVAAAVALPRRGGGQTSAQRIRATVDGRLALQLEPTVVTARAHHLAEVTAVLGAGGELTATEQVLLGRWGEDPGRWTGTIRIERAGRPVLHTTVGLGPGEPAWLPPVAPRAYASLVHLGSEQPDVDVRTGADAVRLPIPGGWVTTAWGTELHRVLRAVEGLDPRTAVRVPA
jgi:urease accessory protein